MLKKLFTTPTLVLFIIGLILNVVLVWLTGKFNIPLYLDSIGTVIVAVLGGLLPGIAVGFLSNCLTALISLSPDPMTLYYGFLSVLIAAIASWLSRKGLLLKWYGWLLALAAFSLIGGALGSAVTWILYGFSFGQGISAPLANIFFHNLNLGEFSAQFTADMSIDLLDKLITIGVLGAVLYLLPLKIMEKMPLGFVYQNRKKLPKFPPNNNEKLDPEKLFHKFSIRTKITLLIVVSATILSILALTISIVTYKGKMIEQYSSMCSDAVSMMLPQIDGNQVENYLAEGEKAAGYASTEQELYNILNNAHELKYMYVYSIQPDGCHVVFDLDAEGLLGEPAGAVVAFDPAFPYLKETLAGEGKIPAFITNGTYGWLLTVYKPIRNAQNEVVAYAAADIDMKEIKTNLYSFGISIASLLFGVMIILTAFSLWYCDRKLLAPLSILVEQARDFDFGGEHTGNRVRDKHTVQTKDELEEVFTSMCRTEDMIAEHVAQINGKNLEISHMQRNIIYTLANMVESRDSNTGGHIKRTANYVLLIGQKLQELGIYAETVSDEYLKMLFDSAPLHDIGKIKIPDAVLNKPGRLTPEEFNLMKTHSAEGAEILRTSLSDIEDGTWLEMAIEMAECHHERWDGKGYPNGLSGEDIPLCARIMAVSDVFDALVSERSYKAAFSFEAAMEIISEGAGSQFDPQIVQAFQDDPNKVCKIKNSQ